MVIFRRKNYTLYIADAYFEVLFCVLAYYITRRILSQLSNPKDAKDDDSPKKENGKNKNSDKPEHNLRGGDSVADIILKCLQEPGIYAVVREKTRDAIRALLRKRNPNFLKKLLGEESSHLVITPAVYIMGEILKQKKPTRGPVKLPIPHTILRIGKITLLLSVSCWLALRIRFFEIDCDRELQLLFSENDVVTQLVKTDSKNPQLLNLLESRAKVVLDYPQLMGRENEQMIFVSTGGIQNANLPPASETVPVRESGPNHVVLDTLDSKTVIMQKSPPNKLRDRHAQKMKRQQEEKRLKVEENTYKDIKSEDDSIVTDTFDYTIRRVHAERIAEQKEQDFDPTQI